jgi:hypothetical protein
MSGRMASPTRVVPPDASDEQPGSGTGGRAPAHPQWPSVPGQAYEALSGASSELVRPVVRAGQAGTLANLEGTLMSLHMAVLAARPAPRSTRPATSDSATAVGLKRIDHRILGYPRILPVFA